MHHKKSIAYAIIVNSFNYYSITLYAFFSTILTPIFFPPQVPAVSVLVSFAFFALGFLMRPLGAIFFGKLGDQKGRKKAISLSITLTVISTLIISILPTYNRIGILASVIIIICRLAQGFSTACCESGSVIFVNEHAKKNQEGLAGSLLSSSSLIGAFLAATLGGICLHFSYEWIWRIPFFIGGALGIFGYYIQTKTHETEEFLSIKKENKIQAFPLLQVLKKNFSYFIKGIGITSATIAPFYISCTYVSNIAQQKLEFSNSETMFLNACVMLGWIIVLPLIGWLSDKIGKINIMTNAAIGIIVIASPVFWLLSGSLTLSSIIWVQLLLCVFGASYVAPVNAILPRLFPAEMRQSGMGFSFALGATLFGGFTPLIISFINYKTQTEIFLLVYLMFIGIVGLLSLKNLYPCTPKKTLIT